MAWKCRNQTIALNLGNTRGRHEGRPHWHCTCGYGEICYKVPFAVPFALHYGMPCPRRQSHLLRFWMLFVLEETRLSDALPAVLQPVLENLSQSKKARLFRCFYGCVSC